MNDPVGATRILSAPVNGLGLPVDVQLGAGAADQIVAAVSELAGLPVARLLLGEGAQDVFTLAGAAAQVTADVEIGTNVAIAFARTPMAVAYSSWTLQSLTGGRFVLGLGSQVRGHIVRRFGMPWSAPARRMREYVEALHAIWASWRTGEALAFRGEFYEHTLMPPAFVPEIGGLADPRILLAGVGPLMVETAGAVADGFISHPFSTSSSVRSITVPALHRGAASNGRTLDDLEITCCVMAICAEADEDVERAWEAARAQIAFYGSTPAYASVLAVEGLDDLHGQLHTLSTQGRWSEMAALIDDAVVERVCVAGTPGEVLEQAAAHARGWADRVVIMPPFGGADGDPRELVAWYERLLDAARS